MESFGSTSLASSYKAFDPKTNEHITLKVLRPHFFEGAVLVDKFKQAMLSASQAEHPNIAKIFDVGQEGNEVWMSRAYVPFGSLRQLKLPASKADVVAIIGGVATALDYLHSRGKVHGDLKLSNVFFDGSKVILTDHGMTAAVEDLPSLIKSTVNTPLPVFAAPEYTQHGSLTPAADIYALGVLAFYLLTGEPPYYATDHSSMLAKQLTKSPPKPSELSAWLTLAVDEAILRAISVEPDRRPKSAGAFAEELRRALESVIWPSEAELLATEEIAKAALAPAKPDPQTATSEPAGGSISTRNILIRLKKINRKKLVKNTFVTTAFFSLLVGGWLLYDIVGLPQKEVQPSTSVTSEYSLGEWPTLLGGPTHTGFIPEAAAPIKGNVKWTLETGDRLTAQPVIANGTLFLATTDKRVLALNPEDGGVKWTYGATGPVDAAPTVVDGKVYFGLRDGRMIALNANDGSTAWEFQTEGYIFNPATIHNGVLYFGSGDNNLYAIDAATGKELWRFGGGNSISGPASISSDIVVVSSWSGSLYLLDAKTGKKRLNYVMPTVAPGSIVVVGDTAYAAGSRGRTNTLYSIDTRVSEFRTERWVRRFMIQMSIWGLVDYPVIKGTRWAVRLSEPTSWISAADGKIYGLSQRGTLYTWNAADGKELSKVRLGDRADSLPLIVGDTIYAANWFGDLYAFDRQSGNQLLKMKLDGGSVTVPPSFSTDTLFITAGNTLYAIE